MRIAVHDYAGHPFQVELSRSLARRGHDVRHFYFAEDIGPKGPSATAPDDPERLSIEAVSMPGPYSKSDFIRRRRGDIRYGRSASAAIAHFAPDVVISGNTPLEAQQHIARASHDIGAAFVFWVQDAYSLAIERILGRRWFGVGAQVAGHYRRMEAALIHDSEAVVLIGEAFRPRVLASGVEPGRVAVIPNWGALGMIAPTAKTNAWALAHGLADKFVFLYSGTLALKHDPQLLWALADAFAGCSEVRIVVAAAGVGVDALAARLAKEPLDNLVFLPLQPVSVFESLLGAADVVVAMLEADAGEFSVPSKVLSYLCSGRPILMSTPLSNLAVEIVSQAGAGDCVPPGDTAGFIAAAQRLHQSPERRREMGAAARSYAERAFDIESVCDRFERVFADAVDRRRSR